MELIEKEGFVAPNGSWGLLQQAEALNIDTTIQNFLLEYAPQTSRNLR